ncbi:polyprenyl synthetase family protein [Candidatus Neptunochlamydia vexilliferae]|uniref:polyprenyl synthetase family protein n=1 Tax=Candidatus Neptunichlamydia vexilliferae TaxID=1651774 RepID=UPI001891D433|nr:farnesyl diphosphate synthase [Candidatus Neptunochlamydia vexilliferae]
MILRSLINKHLEKLLPPGKGPHAPLFEAARYSLLLPGKRLRPELLLKVLDAYDIPAHEGLDAAAALEMIHTYSLIHDDLPCMDDDDLRRGKPTLHKVYDEGQAVLAGDFLLTYAFEVLAKSAVPREVITIFAKAAGGHGMIGGQVIDLLSEGKEIDWDTLKQMYLGKTAALFSAALEAGGVIAGASTEDQAALKEAGNYYGISFQIQDDILDETGTEESMGKPVGSDVANRKANILTLFGRARAEALAQTFMGLAKKSIPPSCASFSGKMESLQISYT